MPFNFSSLSFKPSMILKTIGIIFAAIILLALAIRLVIHPLQSSLGLGGISSMGGGMFNRATDSYKYGQDVGSAGMAAELASAPGLSIRNMLPWPQPPMDEDSVGNMAEEYEATDYHATIETGDLKRACDTVASLKSDTEIVFERTSESDHSCNFTFKAAKDRVPQVLAVLEGLNPKDLAENTYTIQRTVEDFTSEIEILEKKRDTIESTLDAATKAYDEITNLATGSRDVATLAKIIDSKLQMLERLTEERIQVNAQLDQLARAKTQQMDNVEYTSFFVNIYENKFVDGEQLKDSWKAAVKDFFRDVNTIIQDLTVNLVKLLLLAIQYFIYILLLVLFAKMVWSVTKGIWKK
jgi:hypothetical protein